MRKSVPILRRVNQFRKIPEWEQTNTQIADEPAKSGEKLSETLSKRFLFTDTKRV
jgi:hypothetical protein